MRITESNDIPRTYLVHRALPPLREIEQSIIRILIKWPDAVVIPEESDREKIALEFLNRVNKWDWEKVSVSRLLQASLAVFDEQRANRVDLAAIHSFIIDETKTSKIASFLSGMLWVYISSFVPNATHTIRLAEVIASRRGALGERTEALFSHFPELLNPSRAPTALAEVMSAAENPYLRLREMGFNSPHAPGLTSYAGAAFVSQIEGRLSQDHEQERLFAWMAPKTGDALQTNAAQKALFALLRPWQAKTINPERQTRLSEWIVANYGDPRTQRGGIWPNFDPALKEVLLRWLTKEDMNFFCDVVSATQDSHMWPPRRKFWMGLHEQGRIEQAWVAFGSEAKEYARTNLMREGAKTVGSRFGSQKDRGGSTSLLIMKIGRKIVVDGCHNYKTHIFDSVDLNAPKLYQPTYYCDDIMRLSPTSKSHSAIANWQTWVHRNI